MSDEDSNIRYEPELGVHHAGTEIDNDEVKRRYKFEVQAKTAFKRFSEDIYRGKKAGIREPMSNSVTSILRAVDEGHISKDAGTIVVNLYELDGGDSLRLTLRDNGIGMTRDEIDEIITKIGESTARSNVDLAGEFGMGFLAIWMIAGGTQGAFNMYSNPRGIEEGPFYGIWDSNGFSEMDEPDSRDVRLRDGEHGVLLDIFVDPNITSEELLNWIEKYSKWTRVPVLLRHHTDSGVEDEEYPPLDIQDKYKTITNMNISNSKYTLDETNHTELTYYQIESEAFNVVNSNLLEERNPNSIFSVADEINRTILLDVPVDTVLDIQSDFPLPSIELRLKYETPYVVDGPHQGNFVVVGGRNPEELGDNYISEDSLTVDDVMTPYPTGTRDLLKDPTDFMQWLGSKMSDIYYQDVATLVKRVDTIKDFATLSDEDAEDFFNVLSNICDTRNFTGTKSDIKLVKDSVQTSFDDNFERALEVLTENVSYAPEGEDGVSRKDNRNPVPIHKLARNTYNSDKNVFIGHRVTQERAEFVWTADADHYVARAKSQNKDMLQNLFGWRDLTDVDFETDLSMSESDRKDFTEDVDDITEKRITLHQGSYGNTQSMSVKELEESIEEGEIADKIMIFHRYNENISDYTSVIGDALAGSSVPNDVYEYLQNKDGILTTEYIDNGRSVLTSNRGLIDIGNEAFPENSVFHVVDKETAQWLRSNWDVMNDIELWISQHLDPNSVTYVPITPVERDLAGISFSYNGMTVDTQHSSSSQYSNGVPVDSDVELYAKAVLNESKPEYEALKTVKANWSDGGKEIVEAVIEKDL